MKKNYKIALIGLGLIGTRHLLNIEKVLKNRKCSYSIDLIRRKNSKSLDDEMKIYKVYTDLHKAPNNYDVIFITNPTHLHYDTLKEIIHKTKDVFIEKPVFHTANIPIEDLNLKKDSNYYVACPLRYTDVIQYVLHEIDLTKVLSARAICSSYLPDWRPGIDYNKTYSAYKEKGGGVSIDLIHEWDYLQYLFGQPIEVLNINSKVSDLNISSEDISIYIAKYKNMLVELHLDYFGKKTIRQLQLITSTDTIMVDIFNSKIEYLVSGEVIHFNEERNDFQLKEMDYFFDMVEGKVKNINNIETAMNTLQIASNCMYK